jgi:ABC-type polysaccharide/polyol phosphate export permease
VEPGSPEEALSDVQFSDAVRAERFADQIETRRGIPRLQPRTADELPGVPPSKARYPVSLAAALRELVAAREQLRTFVERDLRVRYRQAVLGAGWAVLQPLFLMVVFSLAFGRIARVGSEGAPYALFSYSALVPWGFFIGSINYGISNILANAPIVRRIYLPRDVIPLASVLSAAVDFLASGVILLAMLMAYGYGPRLTWLAYPVLFAILVLFAVAGTLLASLITVYFRDTRYAIPTLLQAVLFATPVAYPVSKVLGALPAGARSAYLYLNPLAPLMDGFHRVLLHGQWPAWGPVGSAALIGAVAVIVSYRLYKRMDPGFADVI